jgi:flagellar basal body-associated protein FliL
MGALRGYIVIKRPWVYPLFIFSDEEDEEEDDESGATKIVFVLLAVSGSFLFLAVLVGICLWRINRRNKTKKLTKDRVSVNYKYDPMKRTNRQSIITDPTVTNDLE